ncbi:hypothetical protein ACOCJ7_12630 [Knoellia sp. CPCC 206453]|uniref:hypothetical protein n=1 Tax=Knoellia pratensis TaxID=3404796 RepID=UPI00361928E7
MSDHTNRPQPGEDPLADRLRAFGSQSAHTTTLPPVEEIHRGGDRRRRNQRIATAGATLAVAAIIGGTVIASQLGNGGDDTLLPATPAAIPTATTPAVTPSVARIDLGGKATVVVPQGWTSQGLSTYVDDAAGSTVETVCLNDGKANGLSVDCDIEIQWGPVTLGSERQPWTPGQAGGWYHRTDAAPCFLPTGDLSAPDQGDIMQVDQTPTKSYAPVGSKMAEMYRYAVSCAEGRSFTSTMWWLPTTQLRFHDLVGNTSTAEILASVRFAGE